MNEFNIPFEWSFRGSGDCKDQIAELLNYLAQEMPEGSEEEEILLNAYSLLDKVTQKQFKNALDSL